MPVGAPFDRVAIDILGELPETENGNKYILVIVDYFTKWTQAFALPNQTAQTIADTLMIHVFSLFGMPRQLHSDQGRNFESGLFAELNKLLGVEKTRTTPYRPQSDGMVERFNRTIQQMLKAFVNENRNDWDDHLPYLTMAYRASVHDSTGCTPQLLMLGREVRMPIDIMFGPPPMEEEHYQCPVEYVEWVRRTLANTFQFAQGQSGKSAVRQKRNYDAHVRPRGYVPGQFVWRWYPPSAKGKLGKGWIGPYKVVTCPNEWHCMVQRSPTDPEVRVHVDLLQPHRGPQPQSWETQPPSSNSLNEEIGGEGVEQGSVTHEGPYDYCSGGELYQDDGLGQDNGEEQDHRDEQELDPEIDKEKDLNEEVDIIPETLTQGPSDSGLRRGKRKRKPPNRLDL
jgi:hypothetical protein